MKSKKILHITPHLGGGVGSVVVNYLLKASENKEFEHKVICLGYVDERAKIASENPNFPEIIGEVYQNHNIIKKEIENSDIILIHWWNHPLLANFMIREKLPPNRMAIWSHIVGHPAPNNLTEKLLKYPDIFVFTTPLSYGVPEVINLEDNYKKNLKDIWSTGTIDHVRTLKQRPHKDFNIGYIGTVDFAKMHPDFLQMSAKTKIKDVKFIVIGSPNADTMRKNSIEMNIENKFNFTGFISDEEKWSHLETFDLFGYPLVPKHYGTCDLALQEAMTVGAVPVVLANPMESYMVKDGITGIVAKNTNEYTKALNKLYRDERLRNKLSKNAKRYALEKFSLSKMIDDWTNIFDNLMKIKKSFKKWQIKRKVKELLPFDIFIESLGNYHPEFSEYIEAKNKVDKALALEKIKYLSKYTHWQSESKSTVHNFNNFLKGDKKLKLISKIMKKYQK